MATAILLLVLASRWLQRSIILSQNEDMKIGLFVSYYRKSINVNRKLCPTQINYMGIRVVVVGGSLGGLSSALVLRCVNCDVDVFERSGGAMKSRGAGLVVQTELVDFLKEHGIVSEEAISIPAYKRQYLSQDGSIQWEDSLLLPDSYYA